MLVLNLHANPGPCVTRESRDRRSGNKKGRERKRIICKQDSWPLSRWMKKKVHLSPLSKCVGRIKQDVVGRGGGSYGSEKNKN